MSWLFVFQPSKNKQTNKQTNKKTNQKTNKQIKKKHNNNNNQTKKKQQKQKTKQKTALFAVFITGKCYVCLFKNFRCLFNCIGAKEMENGKPFSKAIWEYRKCYKHTSQMFEANAIKQRI